MPCVRCAVTLLLFCVPFCFALCIYILLSREGDVENLKKRAGCARSKIIIFAVPPNPRKAVSAETRWLSLCCTIMRQKVFFFWMSADMETAVRSGSCAWSGNVWIELVEIWLNKKANGWSPRFRGLMCGEGKKICIFVFFFSFLSLFPLISIDFDQFSLCRIKVPSRFRCVTSNSSATMLLVDPGLCSWVLPK